MNMHDAERVVRQVFQLITADEGLRDTCKRLSRREVAAVAMVTIAAMQNLEPTRRAKPDYRAQYA